MNETGRRHPERCECPLHFIENARFFVPLIINSAR
jgi:hypothetical protein